MLITLRDRTVGQRGTHTGIPERVRREQCVQQRNNARATLPGDWYVGEDLDDRMETMSLPTRHTKTKNFCFVRGQTSNALTVNGKSLRKRESEAHDKQSSPKGQRITWLVRSLSQPTHTLTGLRGRNPCSNVVPSVRTAAGPCGPKQQHGHMICW